MTAAVWTAIGLLAATSLGALFSLGARIDAQGARIDSLGARIDARFDDLVGRIDARFDGVAVGSIASPVASMHSRAGSTRWKVTSMLASTTSTHVSTPTWNVTRDDPERGRSEAG